jgi:hypothetical protein
VQHFLNKLIQHPKQLFLIDGLGALVTAFILFVVLKRYNAYVGMPQNVLTYLSLIAIIFCLYSITCFFVLSYANWQPFLKIISLANVLYCCITLSLVCYYYHSIKLLGIIYFLAEIIVICALVVVEINTLRKWQKT